MQPQPSGNTTKAHETAVDPMEIIVRDEFINMMIHGLGILLSLAGGIVMGTTVFRGGDSWRIWGCMVYAPSLIAMYAMSTLSHGAWSRPVKHIFRRLDQAFIFILIVATYTPFSLAYLRSGPWWAFLGVMWTIGLGGFASKLLFGHRIDGISIWIYILLGWMPVCAAPALLGTIPAAGLWWMLIGGLFYTVGTAFLMSDHRHRSFHAIWHFLVIAASACHYFVILECVAKTG